MPISKELRNFQNLMARYKITGKKSMQVYNWVKAWKKNRNNPILTRYSKKDPHYLNKLLDRLNRTPYSEKEVFGVKIEDYNKLREEIRYWIVLEAFGEKKIGLARNLYRKYHIKKETLLKMKEDLAKEEPELSQNKYDVRENYKPVAERPGKAKNRVRIRDTSVRQYVKKYGYPPDSTPTKRIRRKLIKIK